MLANRRALIVQVMLYLLLVLPAYAGEPPRADLTDVATKWWRLLSSKTLPYWYTTIDSTHGGYLLNDPGPGRQAPGVPVKQLVTQSRMIWAFSHAHRLGLSSEKHDYFAAAQAGYRFLVQNMRDPIYGGYYWKLTPDGKLLVDRKYLYGQAFVIYALVEFFRAGGPAESLELAEELFHTVQEQMHDPAHAGWLEHFTRDWQWITTQDQLIEVELAGLKSANAHLHWMEALSELYDVTRDPEVRTALEEALDLNKRYFYPPDGSRCRFWMSVDWKEVKRPRADEVSYGHNVEFAWLMLRAEQLLGRTQDIPHFRALLKHALDYGEDRNHGGLMHLGRDNEAAFDRRKIWWVQAEWIAALSIGMSKWGSAEYVAALERAVRFVDQFMIDPQTGVWFDTVAADGSPVNAARAHPWKAAYHDLRAQVLLINTITKGRLAAFKR